MASNSSSQASEAESVLPRKPRVAAARAGGSTTCLTLGFNCPAIGAMAKSNETALVKGKFRSFLQGNKATNSGFNDKLQIG